MTTDTSRAGVLVIVDIDGTLVDSNYQHALAWHRALRGVGATVPLWRIHRAIGMGGDRIVAALAGDDVERDRGDEARAAEARIFGTMIDEVVPLPGARDALTALAGAARGVVLASSARAEEVEHHVDLLGVRDIVDGWTTAADVDRTKPAPDLIDAARRVGGGGPAIMVGDATWDALAARRAGMPMWAVLTGGYGARELLDAGAESVHAGLGELAEGIAGSLRLGAI